jgi:hypothetical protein
MANMKKSLVHISVLLIFAILILGLGFSACSGLLGSLDSKTEVTGIQVSVAVDCSGVAAAGTRRSVIDPACRNDAADWDTYWNGMG